MQILLIIENIAHRRRMMHYLGNRPGPLIAKSVAGAYKIIDGLTLDVIICDLVVGSTTAAQIFDRARAIGRPTPRCLCLIPDGMANHLEVNSFREISQVDDIDLMKKSDVEQVLGPYLLRVAQEAGERSAPTPATTRADAPTSQSRALPTPTQDMPQTTADDQNEFRDRITRLDRQHEQIANTLSQVQESFAAVEKQVSAIESRIEKIESRNETPADQLS